MKHLPTMIAVYLLDHLEEIAGMFVGLVALLIIAAVRILSST